MSLSPLYRHPSATSAIAKQEELINAYEAEEERIINVLSRKLEQIREEKIELENALEAESESHVNRMSRELTALRLAQQQLQAQQANGNGMMSVSVSPDTRIGFRSFMGAADPSDLSAETMLEAMRRENEQLRNRLVDTERDYVRVTRLNEIYREELIEHRRRMGLSVDNLIGLSSDPYSQPTHHRSPSYSSASSPSTSVFHMPTYTSRSSHSVPIPRPPSQIQRPINNIISGTNTPLSHSPSSAESPFPFSPSTSANPASFLSTNTNITSPPSSVSLNGVSPMTFGTISRSLTYPSVPPPSLSSSFGSPTVSYHMPHREHSLSPIEPLSRRNSNARRGSIDRRMGVTESGGHRTISRSETAGRSTERGGRVAETGSLLSRSRAGSHSLLSTAEVSPQVMGTMEGNKIGIVDSHSESS